MSFSVFHLKDDGSSVCENRTAFLFFVKAFVFFNSIPMSKGFSYSPPKWMNL